MDGIARKLIVGNWKMNGLDRSLDEVDKVGRALDGSSVPVDCVICPPMTLIHRAASRRGRRLKVGAQDCAVGACGAHTGDVSAEMLRDAGAAYVILGHSERRLNHGETDGTVRAKAAAVLEAGLTAIICVGETREQREQGEALAIVGRQLVGSMPKVADTDAVVVAYEPVWAIGTGLVPTETEIAAIHGGIRSRLHGLLGTRAATTRVLYGGSVRPDNASCLMGIADVDGVLVGGASLRAADFLTIAGIHEASWPRCFDTNA